ncbi:MAG: hypothetical protein QOH72_184 [Solirubrobacteraceae bacterium]|jgi:hypothetical protein|nr:hypothetical protein [Solirubrobacteraceae bacterium]
MPHSEARAWWADVQDVRESIERRRAGLADSSASLDAPAERRFVRRSAESLPPVDDLDRTSGSASHAGGRFDRTGTSSRSDHPRPRSRRTGPDRRGGDGAGDRHELERETGRLSAVPAAGSATAPTATAALSPPPARRTVQITGRTVAAPTLPRLVEVERRRPARRPAERVGPRPDRVALWAVLLGFFLILVAATSSNAAVPPAHAADRAAVALHAPAR